MHVHTRGGWGWVTISSWQPGFQNALIFPARASAPDVSSCPWALAWCPTPSGRSECLLSEPSQTGRGVPRHFRPLGSDRQELLLSKQETGKREMSLPFCSGRIVSHQNLCKTSDHSFERERSEFRVLPTGPPSGHVDWNPSQLQELAWATDPYSLGRRAVSLGCSQHS